MELDRLLPKGKDQKIIGLMKYDLSRKIMPEIVGLKGKLYSYLIDDGSTDKKTKRNKKSVS